VKHVQNGQFEKSQFVKWDQAKYAMKIKTNKKGKIKQLHIVHRSYPLYNKGYDNYEEFNVNLIKLFKYTDIDIYFIREDWNGTGYFPVCHTKIQLPDEFFNSIVGELETDSDIRTTVLALFKRLKNVLEKSGEDNECFYATYYFPL